jgi:hypothetical protein
VACREALGLPGTMMRFDWNSAFWVNNAVAKLVYAEYDRAAPIVTAAKCAFEQHLAPQVAQASAAARAHFEAGESEAGAAVLTALAEAASLEATKRWTSLWQDLMVANLDGYSTTANPNDLMCGCTKVAAKFSDTWAAKVVADTGDHYRLPDSSCVYIDPDGHCHSSGPTLVQPRRVVAIPKHLVRGVMA